MYYKYRHTSIDTHPKYLGHQSAYPTITGYHCTVNLMQPTIPCAGRVKRSAVTITQSSVHAVPITTSLHTCNAASRGGLLPRNISVLEQVFTWDSEYAHTTVLSEMWDVVSSTSSPDIPLSHIIVVPKQLCNACSTSGLSLTY